MNEPNPRQLTHADLLQLKRWNTPTIYNGWEQITKRDAGREGFNLEPVVDRMPGLGAMCGRAVTLVIEPGNPEHPKANPDAWIEYWRHVASVPGPKVVVVQDMDKPSLFGSAWGEVNASVHKVLGCVGAIVDGAARDLVEMESLGFKVLSRAVCVGHAYATPVRWGVDVEVFGRRISPGQLIHADRHGFLAVPAEDEARLLDASRIMDSNECATYLAAVRDGAAGGPEATMDALVDARERFRATIRKHFGGAGEW